MKSALACWRIFQYATRIYFYWTIHEQLNFSRGLLNGDVCNHHGAGGRSGRQLDFGVALSDPIAARRDRERKARHK